MEKIDRTLLTFVGVALGIVLAVAAILIAMYVVVESSEAEIRAEMQRMESDLKAEMQRMETERKSESQRLEAERKSESQRLEAERKSEMAALIAQFDRFIERVDSRLDKVEQEQARLNAVNDLLAEQAGR